MFNNPKYLEAFYKALFEEEVKTLEIILETEIKGDNIFQKTSVIDCLSKINDKYVHIEMQNVVTKDLLIRIQFYAYLLIARLAAKGAEYGEIKKIRSIWIINGRLNREDTIYMDKIGHVYKVRNKEIGQELVEIYIIELPKIMEDKFGTIDIENVANQMLYLIKAKREDEVLKMIREKNPMINEIVETVCTISEEDKMEIAKLRQEESYRAYISDLGCAREEGREEGVKQGVKQGVKRGANQEKMRVVMNMYKNKFDIKTICLALDLSKKDVERILEKTKNKNKM